MEIKEKKTFLFCLIVFFGFCAVFAAQKIKSFDIWWHLKTGEWIWEHKAIPFGDPFSYTFQGAKWIDFEWLFQAVIYPIYQLGGFEGLIIFKIIVIMLTFLILFLTCREVDGGKKWLSLVFLFIALLVAQGRFMVRPQIISLFFLALYLYFLTLHREGTISTRQLILFLVPAHILWVNFHGSFLLGIFLVGAYALGIFVPLALRHHRDLRPVFQDKELRSLSFLCLLLCVVSLLNPHTYHAFLLPLKTAGAQEALGGISEWQPVDIKFVGVFAIEGTMWFRALFILGLASFLINKRNLMKVENILIFLLFSYMAFKHIRFCGDFAIANTPIIVYNFTAFRWQIKGWKWLRILPLIVVIGFCVRDIGEFIKIQRLGFGVQRYYPTETADFLQEHFIQGRIYNHYDFGGYLIWRLYPDIFVFIDGRTPTIYDQDFFWLYDLGERKKEVWDKIVERYGVEIVLMRDQREQGYASLFYWLDEDEDWRLVAFDDVSNLYMKKGAKFNNLIEQYGFRYLRPAEVSMDYAKRKKGDEKYLKDLEEELQEACQRFPRDFYPFYYLGVYHQIYGTTEHLREAEKSLRRAVANSSNSPRGYYELGFTLMKLERYDEAIEALKKAIRLNPYSLVDAYYYLGFSLFQEGKINEAISFLETYKEKAGFGTKIEAYRILGRAYLQKCKLQKALSCFKREEYLEGPTWENSLNKGVAYFGLGKLNNARLCFERAKEFKSDDLKTVYNLALVYEKLGYIDQAKKLFKEAAKIKTRTPEEEEWAQRAREKAK